MSAKHSYYFGVYWVYVAGRELFREGEPVALSPKMFDTLLLLLSRHGHVVDKQELMKSLWPDTYVEEDNLVQQVSRLRKTLGERPEGGSYIETVARRGYRFAAPVEESWDGEPAESQPAVAEPSLHEGGRAGRWRRFAWLMGAAFALSLGVTGWLFIFRPGSHAPEVLLTPVPLTTYPGNEEQVSFSPDGNQVAFTWNGEREDNSDIYVKLIGSDPPSRLTTNPADDTWPAWSPDGRQIAFCRDLGPGKGAVVLKSPLGGPERILTECSTPWRSYATGPYLSWSPDGRALAMVEGRDVGGVKLTMYMLETGEKYPLFKDMDNSVDCPWDSSPAFSPDGRTLTFCRWVRYGISDLYLLDLSRDLKPVGEPRRLTFQNSHFSGAAWTSDGSALVYSMGGNSLSAGANLWRVSAFGSGQPQKLASLGEDAYSPAISHRASRLAYTHSTTDRNIWRIGLSSPQGKANPPTRLISSTRDDLWGEYSPDGKKITFCSNRSGSYEIWACDADGSNPIQLTHIERTDISLPRWSPDGSRLTFNSIIEEHVEIYVVNASGENLRRLTSSTQSENPRWSVDGRWIYFNSGNVIKKIPAEGGQEEVVLKDTLGFAPVESPDVKYIYLSGPGTDKSNTGLLRIPVAGGAPRQILDSIVWWPAYALEDDGIYFIPGPDPAKGYSIRFLELSSGKIKTVAELGKQLCYTLSISPDRRWALYTQLDQSGWDLMLVENFR